MSIDKYTGTNCIRTYPMQQPYMTSTLRFTDKENNECERQLYSDYMREQIQLYGQKVSYYRNTTSTLSADNIYGEQPLARFENPQSIIMMVNLTENALILSKFGFQSDDQITAYVHISSFYAVYPPDTEPKAGDIFKLTEYGSDRPGERDGKLFEITERVDQDNSQINPLMGHYVWMLKAKRFDYSFEPNAPIEKGSNQVHDDTQYGTIDPTNSENTFVPRTTAYPGDADATSKSQVFNMGVNNTLEYGGYY